MAPAATATGEAQAGRAVVAVDEAAAAAEAAASEKAATAEKAAEELAAETAAIEEATTAEKATEKLAAAEEAAAANRAAEVEEAAAADRAADKAAEAGARWAAAKEAAAEKAVADKEAATDREAAKEVAVRQATAAGRAAAEVDWRNRKRLREDWEELAEGATAEWKRKVSSIQRRMNPGCRGEWTEEEEAIVRGFVRGHKEVTAAKEKEAWAELAVTRRAAAERAGSNMGRYDEILGRNKALGEAGFDRKDKKAMEEWEEIKRLHGEAMKDGEEYFL